MMGKREVHPVTRQEGTEADPTRFVGGKEMRHSSVAGWCL